MKHTILVQGMHCNSCCVLVKSAVEELGAKNVQIKLNEKRKQGKVILEYEGNKSELINAINKEGYKAL